MIQSSGVEANTFRIESIGTAGNKAVSSSYASRADRRHLPRGRASSTSSTSPSTKTATPPSTAAPKECENYYPKRVSLGINGKCTTIEFADGDTVEGPMHTDDATDICAPRILRAQRP